MSDLAPGAVCYLVRLAERLELCGRVVEVVGPAQVTENESDWYTLSAPWTVNLFGESEIIARRCNLLPILPKPEPAPPAGRKHIPQNAE